MATPVLIGTADDSNFDDNYSATHLDNRIGGKPVFSLNLRIPSNLDLSCKNCQKDCSFLMQIYCPVDESPVDRVLYLFICSNKPCKMKQIICYRTLTEPLAINGVFLTDKKSEKLFDDEWLDDGDNGANDWSVNDNGDNISKDDNDLSSKLSSIELDSAIQQTFVESFKQCFISVFEEPENSGPVLSQKVMEQAADFLQDFNETKTPDNKQQSGDVHGEEYEKILSSGFKNDRINYRFYKQLNRCPSQIIRYSWNGAYLPFNAQSQGLSPRKCDYCGEKRTFELQLMPALISNLSRLSFSDLSIDFETVYIFTCLNNCPSKHGPSTIHKEDVIVQYEDTENLEQLQH